MAVHADFDASESKKLNVFSGPLNAAKKAQVACGVGKWTKADLSACVACTASMPNCKDCGNDNSCYSCLDNFYMLMNKCLKTCPTGFYADKTTKTCKKCKDCTKCKGPKATDCYSCEK